MGITVEILISIFAILSTISLAAERLIEMAKPLFNKIKYPEWQASAKLFSAIIIGFCCSALFRFDLLAQLGISGVSVLVGYLAAGLISSSGSTVINRFLEWLKTLKSNTTVSTTTTTSQDNVVVQETTVAKGSEPVVIVK
jgi:hypothetical protein